MLYRNLTRNERFVYNELERDERDETHLPALTGLDPQSVSHALSYLKRQGVMAPKQVKKKCVWFILKPIEG